MTLYVGTSGYAYKAWKGRFYPADLPGKQMLHYYGQRFRAVEVNNSFYRMPTAAVLEAWAEAVPADFRFVLKAPRRITHVARLKNAEEPLVRLLDVAAALKARLGPLLFQLPSQLAKDAGRLRDFLALLPQARQVAFEFRHASWFDEEIYQLLGDHQAALCIAEAEDGPEVPCVATADWGYVRLRRPDYREAELQTWVQRLRAQAWADTFVFFKHEDEARGPRLATRFLEMAA